MSDDLCQCCGREPATVERPNDTRYCLACWDQIGGHRNAHQARGKTIESGPELTIEDFPSLDRRDGHRAKVKADRRRQGLPIWRTKNNRHAEEPSPWQEQVIRELEDMR